MKTTTLTLSALAVLAGLAACTKENFNPSSSDTHNDGNGLKVTLVAGQENEAGTRAAIGETTGDDKKTTTILWSAGDKLSVFDGDNSNIEFSIKSGIGTASGTFEGEVSKTSDSYVALHPYQSAATINSGRNTISNVTLSSEQSAVAGSFDPEAALMVATESTDGNLAFKNVVGYIKVTPTSDCKKITLTSNSTSVNLAGTVDISLASDGTPTASIASGASGASNSVSIEGTIKANTTYYIAALPATLEGGFKLVFTDNEDKETSTASSKTLTIKRNTIADLGNGIPYVTFSAASAQKFTMTLPDSGVENTFEYSVGGSDWTAIESGTAVDFGGANNDLRLRGKSSVGTATGAGNFSTISFTESVEVQCSGDIRTLVDYEHYASADTKDARFTDLFYECSVLTSAPELPATTLANSCYYEMFIGCTKLTTVPEKLPAETLAPFCYYSMFDSCTSLTTAPVLPAKALVESCYRYMFYGCKALTSAPTLPAKTLVKSCYMGMFIGCESLEDAPALPATTLAEDCYNAMFSDCTLLETAPELSVTTLVEGCYTAMFYGCTELKSDIVLPAETLERSCYTSMFYGCTKLTSITIKATSIATSTTQSGALYGWLDGTVSTGDTNTRTIYYADYDIIKGAYPDGWTVSSIPDTTPYLTFSAEAAQVFTMTLKGSGVDASNFEYSVGGGDWKNVTFGNAVEFGGANNDLRLRGKSSVGTATGTSNFSTISFTENVNVQCSGDIRTLVDYTDYADVSTANARFSNLFQSCSVLTSAPELKATTLADYCYSGMFSGCTSLTTAPALPATTLADYCYSSMFSSCTFETAPALPATNLAEGCYAGMFFGCTVLTSAPALPATTLARGCYNSMFLNCTKLETAPKLSATKLEDGCYAAMFCGCTELNSEIELPAETLVASCYIQMFSGCTSLTSITIRATSTTQSGALERWLYGTVPSGDTNTRTIYCANADIISGTYPTGWTVNDLSGDSDGDGGDSDTTPYVTFSAASEQGFTMTLPDSGVENTFEYSVGGSDWTAIESGTAVDFGGANNDLRLRGTSSVGTATSGSNYSTISFTKTIEVKCSGDIRTLVNYKDYKNADTKNARFASLFNRCTSLTTAPELPATTLADNCYYWMFAGCTSLKTAPKLPATTLVDHCYAGMFNACSALTSVPEELPATKLANSCYSAMFAGCSSLKNAPKLPATTLANFCYISMFFGCSSLGSIELPAETLADRCYMSMFSDCTSLTSITLRATSKESDTLGGWLNYTVADDGKTRTIYTDLPLTEGTDYPTGWTVKTLTPYVKFSAVSEQGFKMTLYGVENKFQYSVGNGEWTAIASGEEVKFGGTYGDLRLRGKSSVGTATSISNYSTISFTNDVNVECSGDIRTLVDYTDYAGASTENARFAYLFKGCSVLTSAPTLPAMKLANYCYYYMFVDCTSLKTAPELPAETLAGSCYVSMFRGCTSLTSITIRATSTREDSLKRWLNDTVPTTSDGKTRIIKCANSGIISGTYPEKGDSYPSGWTVTVL